MNTDSRRARINTSARITNEATGVARTACISGESRIRAAENLRDSSAIGIPSANPSRKPASIRVSVKPTAR